MSQAEAAEFIATFKTLAHPRRPRHRPRQPFLRLGPRSRHRNPPRIPRQSRRARLRARHHRRRLRRPLELRKISGRLDRRSPRAPQTRRHHRLSRHRTLHLRLRLRAHVAGDSHHPRSRLGSDAVAAAHLATRFSPTLSPRAPKAAPSASSAPWTRSAPSSALSAPPR